MANDELLIKDEVWLRITQLEYKMKQGMSKEAFEKEVRRIYIEEMGEELPADMKVYSSNESNNLESDYDGTAIYFEDEEKSINQLYVISQGSNDPGDWLYNAIGLFQGKDASQAIDADTFVDEAKKAFNVSDKEVLTVGLGHSLLTRFTGLMAHKSMHINFTILMTIFIEKSIKTSIYLEQTKTPSTPFLLINSNSSPSST